MKTLERPAERSSTKAGKNHPSTGCSSEDSRLRGLAHGPIPTLRVRPRPSPKGPHRRRVPAPGTCGRACARHNGFRRGSAWGDISCRAEGNKCNPATIGTGKHARLCHSRATFGGHDLRAHPAAVPKRAWIPHALSLAWRMHTVRDHVVHGRIRRTGRDGERPAI